MVAVEEFSWNFLLEVDRQSRIGAAKRQLDKPPDLKFNDDLERAASTVCARSRFKYVTESVKEYCRRVLGTQDTQGSHKRAFVEKFMYKASKLKDVPEVKMF